MWTGSRTCPAVGLRVTPGSTAGALATPRLSLRAQWTPESRPSAQPPAPPGSPRHCRTAGPAPGSRGRPRTSRAGGVAGLLGSCCPPVPWWVAACLTALGSGPLPRGPPHNLLVLCGHTHRTAGPLHVHTGPLGARQATTSWAQGLPSRGHSQAGSSCLGWLVPPRVVLAYVPGGPIGPWGGLGPSQAGKGWGPRDGFQGCGPQALTAQALPRGCGRRQRQGALAFLLREECGSGSPHTMVHVGPGRAGSRMVGPGHHYHFGPGKASGRPWWGRCQAGLRRAGRLPHITGAPAEATQTQLSPGGLAGWRQRHPAKQLGDRPFLGEEGPSTHAD